jgi:ABC-type nitrate/sulfonate/bicarbonate transport system substrate-binding protein
VDAGIYLAVERGYDADNGVQLDVAASRRAVERVRAGRADAAVADARDLHGLVAVMALVQRPVHGHLDVVAVSRTTLEDRRDDVRALVHALQRGYVEAQVDPDSAITALLDGADGLDRAAAAADLDAIAPAFSEGAPVLGDPSPARRCAAVDTGLVGPTGRD